MNLPSGLVFFLDFKYGNSFGKQVEGESLAGKTRRPNSPSGSSAPFGEGGFYGEGRYGYTISASTVVDQKSYMVDKLIFKISISTPKYLHSLTASC